MSSLRIIAGSIPIKPPIELSIMRVILFNGVIHLQNYVI